MILLLRSRESADAKPAETGPIDAARQPRQLILGQCADDAVRLTAVFERMDQANLVAPREPFDIGGQRAAAFELLVNPRDEQEITRPGLNGAVAGNSKSAKVSRMPPSPSSSRVSFSLKSAIASAILRRSSSAKSTQVNIDDIGDPSPLVTFAVHLHPQEYARRGGAKERKR